MTFLERSITTLREAGCRCTYVVVSVADRETTAAAEAFDVTVVVTPQAESARVASLRVAMQQLPDDTAAIAVLPVDLPLIASSTVTAMVRSFRENPGALILPFHNGVAGPPVLLGRELFDDVLTRPPHEGLCPLSMESARTL